MSRLEQAVMPFLPALARGDARLTSLLSKERRVLAKWAAKTAYLHSTAYKIGLQYRQLALLVAYWPEPRVQLMPAPYHFPVWSDGWSLRPWTGLAYTKEAEPLLMFVNDLGIFDPPHIVIPGWSP